jgi:hypothetical protein
MQRRILPVNKICCILYNPKTGNGTGEISARNLTKKFQSVFLRFEDITKVEDYSGSEYRDIVTDTPEITIDATYSFEGLTCIAPAM